MEEIIPGQLSVTPLFGGPLPFGIYHHQSIGDIRVKTRTNRKFDGLFVDDIWPGSLLIADFLLKYPFLCSNKNILEIGAGASLPSLVASKLSPKFLVITDYPDQDVLENIRQCMIDNHPKIVHTNIPVSYSVLGYKWGDDVSELLAQLSDDDDNPAFDLIILSEVLWKDTYSQHRNLLKTITSCLQRQQYSQPKRSLSPNIPQVDQILHRYPVALVSFVHRPTPLGDHTSEHDLEFFQIAQIEYKLVSVLLESQEDEETNDIVYLYCLYYGEEEEEDDDDDHNKNDQIL